MMARPSVVLLLGAPGAGKSLLGQSLAAGRLGIVFLSVGEELRRAGLVDELHNRHTSAKLREIRQEARRILEDKISSFLEESPDPCRPRLLLLEYIKEAEDAYVLLEVLAQFELPLLQVLFLPSNNLLRTALKQQAPAASLTQDSRSRDKERRVQERQAKWDANAAQLLEIFSSMGLLTELTATATPSPAQDQHQNLVSSLWRPRSTLARELAAAAAGSLASLGYAAGPAYTAAPSLTAASGPTSSSAGAAPAWLQQAGLQPPPWLAFTPIQPVVSRRLVLQRVVRDRVLAEAAAGSGLKGIVGTGGRLPVPTAAVSSVQQAAWLAAPGRYCVSRKCDGTRHLLIVAADGTPYLKNRAGSLYRYPLEPAGGTGGSSGAAAPALPPGTVVDGELVWVGGRGFFLAFDALAIGSERRVWQLPLKERVRLLAERLHLEEAEGSDALRQAAAAEQAVAANSRWMDRPSATPLLKKLQAPATDSITLLFKQQHDVSSRTLDQLEASRAACPFPSDGLVFTPCDMPYALGMQELMLKWQPWRQAAVDVSGGTQAQHIGTSRLPSCLVYECLPSTGCLWMSKWRPVSVRWDKAHGNAPALVERMRGAWGQPMLEGPAALRQAVSGVEQQLQRAASPPAAAAAAAAVLHPARCLPFGALYSSVMAAVARGTVERTLAEDGLEVFNYTASALAAPQGPAEQICRGLVLHPATSAVVATPFVRFDHGGPMPRPEGPVLESRSHQSPRPRKKAARSASVFWEPDACSPPACASVKVDGSLVIAFLWAGQLRVATRRRLNSEQALWARGWLHANAQLSGFEPGWTYLFEAVYEDNWVVVPYAFEGLVLLGAVSPAGAEVMPEQRIQLAARLGVMPVPCLPGTLHELRSQLPGTGTWTGADASDPPAPAAFEGWVLSGPGGGTWHEKLVQQAYKRVSVAAQLMHPQAVWDRVRCGGESRASLLAGLPPHLRAEMLAMLEALEVSYWGVRDQLQALLQAAGLPVSQSPAGPSQRVHSSAGGGSVGATANSADNERELRQALAISQLEAMVSQMRLEETSTPAASQMELEESSALLGGQTPAAAPIGRHGPDAASSAPAAAAVAVVASASASSCMSAAFLAALDYAALHWSQEDSYTPGTSATSATSAHSLSCPSRSMFFQTTGSLHFLPSNTCKLRGLILDCIKPGPDGQLEGFTPSSNSRQTRAKGWAGGPRAGRLAAPVPLVMEMLPEHSLAEVLGLLSGEDVVSGLLVCKAWQAVMRASPDLKAKLEQGKEDGERRSRDRMRGGGYDNYGGGFDSGFGGGYGEGHGYFEHAYRGYGSS